MADINYTGEIVYHKLTLVVVKIKTSPEKFALYQNYLNSFNPSITIRYVLPKTSDVMITIHNLLGQEVFTCYEPGKAAGTHSLQWSGRGNNGQQLVSGLYLIAFSTGEFQSVQKVVFSR